MPIDPDYLDRKRSETEAHRRGESHDKRYCRQCRTEAYKTLWLARQAGLTVTIHVETAP